MTIYTPNDMKSLKIYADISNQITDSLGVKPDTKGDNLIMRWPIKYDPGLSGSWSISHVADMYMDVVSNKLLITSFHPKVPAHKGFKELVTPCIKVAQSYGLEVVNIYDEFFYDEGCDCPSCQLAFDEFEVRSESSLCQTWDSVTTTEEDAPRYMLPYTYTKQ